KTRATRSRSAWVRAESGETEVGRPRTPSAYGRSAAWIGASDADGTGDAVGATAEAPTMPASTASTSTRAPTTSESVGVMEHRANDGASRRGGPPRPPPSGGGGVGREYESGQGEDHEQDEQDDRELPQAALHAAAAPIHRRITTERPGQADAA